MSEGWGVGNRKEEKAFDTVLVGRGDKEAGLIHGEHPHARQDNSIYARIEDRNIRGELRKSSIYGFDGHRVLIDVALQSRNRIKSSYYSGDEIRKDGECFILFNRKSVYAFYFRDPLDALLTAHRKIRGLMDLPIQLWKESPVGRKIYYRDQPATIARYYEDQGSIWIEPESDDGFTRPAHYDEEDEWDEYKDGVKADILSPHIWWFRKEEDE